MNGHCSPEEGLWRERDATFGDLAKQRASGEGERQGDSAEELYRQLIRVEQHPNGGATAVHLEHAGLGCMARDQVQGLADAFFR